MDRRAIEEALAELGAELERRGVTAQLWVVGGAAMVLAYRRGEGTADVDAVYVPPEGVEEAARDVSARLGLPGDWLSSHVAMFFPLATEEGWLPSRVYGALSVSIVDARRLLAMKLRAGRGARDERDIRLLIDACVVESREEALAVYGEFYPEDPMPWGGRAALEAVLGDRAAGLATLGRAKVANASRPGNRDKWWYSVRGRVAHRLAREDGQDLVMVCGARLRPADARGSRAPSRPRCQRCGQRRPDHG